MEFKKWLEMERQPVMSSSMDAEQAYQWLRMADTDDLETWLVASDALEELGYPNAQKLREAVEKMKYWAEFMTPQTPYDNSPGNYSSVFWEVRQRLIRLQTEVEHWLNRKRRGVEWSGPYQT